MTMRDEIHNGPPLTRCHTNNCGQNGREIVIPGGRKEHLGEAEALRTASALLARGRASGDSLSIKLGHTAAAIARVLALRGNGDGAALLPLVDDLDKAARGILRMTGGLPVPVEDSLGRVHDGSIMGAWDSLLPALVEMVRAWRSWASRLARETGCCGFVEGLVPKLKNRFPRLTSVQSYDQSLDDYKAVCDRLHARVVAALERDQGGDAEGFAMDVLRDLLEVEMKLSGWSPAEIRKALNPVAVRETRRHSPPSASADFNPLG